MDNKRIVEYLNLVCSYIKNKDVHSEVRSELEEHIYEIYEEGIELGLSKDAAIDKAIQRMGDTYTLGNKLNKVHKTKPDYIGLILVGFLGIIGLIVMYIIQNSGAVTYNMTIKTFIVTCVGMVIAIGLYYFDYRKLEKYSFYLYLVTIGITILAYITSNYVNGKPDNVITISILIIVGFLVSLSGVINKLDFTKFKNLVLLLSMEGIAFFTLITISSFTLGVFFLIAFNLIFIFSSINAKYKKIGLISQGVVFAAVFAYTFLLNTYGLYRVRFLLNPKSADELGFGYIYKQSYNLLESAGLFGKDITQVNSNLPLIHTDIAFSSMVYSLGWLVGIIVLIAILIFIIRNILLVKKVKNSFGKSVVLLCTTILFLQFIISILGCFGIISVLYSMPFISYSPGNLISNFIIIGFLLSVYKRKNIKDFKLSNIKNKDLFKN